MEFVDKMYKNLYLIANRYVYSSISIIESLGPDGIRENKYIIIIENTNWKLLGWIQDISLLWDKLCFSFV